jgi:hypothetical protein
MRLKKKKKEENSIAQNAFSRSTVDRTQGATISGSYRIHKQKKINKKMLIIIIMCARKFIMRFTHVIMEYA